MKKLYVLFFLIFFLSKTEIKGQINLTGEAEYDLSISGYVHIDPKACKNIFGLREIRATYRSGKNELIWSGRKFKQNFSHQLTYSESDPIVKVTFHEINRWKTFFGCNGGPRYINTDVVVSSCLDYYRARTGHQLFGLRVKSKPTIKINDSPNPLSLGDEEKLTIDIPTNIKNSFFNWYYRVGGGTPKLIPNAHNFNSKLEILGKEFLTSDDFGKTVYVWAETNCQSSKSNVINFQYQKSAPYITSVLPSKTTCFDSNDGSVKLIFDRPLLSGGVEKISINILDLSTGVYDSTTDKYRYDKVGSQILNLTSFNTSDNSITISNLPKSTTDFKVELLGALNGSGTYTSGDNHQPIFKIGFNPPVAFAQEPSKVNVWCFGGTDGEVTLKAQGGTGNNYHYKWRVAGGNFSDWIPFANAASDTHTIKNLAPNTYEYKISDGNFCVAREQVDVSGKIELGAEIVKSVQIEQPVEALKLEYTGFKEPTAFGLKDGYIVAKVTGGTIKDDNSYNYNWKDQSGVVLSTITTEYTGGAFYIRLNNIGAGSYNLTVTDKNYASATHKTGCSIINSNYFLDQPKPLAVKIEILEEISCNGTNEFNSERDDDSNGIPNEAQNGALVAHAEGGIKLNSTDNGGLPYYYTWKKKNTDGTWTVLSQTDSIARNLSVGDYALNIKDRNGVVLGEYVNNTLVREIDSTFYLPEPPKLLINTTANQITCASGKNGKVKTTVTGGTPPYTYLWSTGDTTQEVDNLYAGKYFVFVTDAKGCQIQDNITIVQPDGISIELIEKKDPTCSYSTDGLIEVAVTGGTPPYRLKWNNNKTTNTINNLVAGDYELSVIDANECNTFFNVTLESATPLEINLGDDRTLCGGQSITLDATLAESDIRYRWSGPNGFSSTQPIVEVSNAGEYIVTVTSLKGCVATDAIVIKTKDVPIDASFLLTSQAYTNTNIEIANVSEPKGESVKWIVPEEATIVSEADNHITLKFKEAGAFDISLISYVQDCFKTTTKTVLVEENTSLPDVGDADNPFIKEFIVYPNPSNGKFKAKVVLAEESAISLRFVNMLTNEVVAKKEEIGDKEYSIDYNTNLASGLYFIILETPEGTETRKVIIK